MMQEKEDLLFLQQIAREWDLGNLLSPPKKISGGLTHKMARLTTEKADLAVKLLSTEIMAREDAKGNFSAAEEWEEKMEALSLPAVYAIKKDGKKMHRLEGRYYYLFPWFEGRILKQEEITIRQAEKMGNLLAKIHQIGKSEGEKESVPEMDFDRPVSLLASVDAELYAIFLDVLPLLKEKIARAKAAQNHLPTTQSLCHNDMDPKNVLWQADRETFALIDLECLSSGSPHRELLETAMAWSGASEEVFDPARMQAFLSAYLKENKDLPAACWSAVLDSFVGEMEWLAFNLRRVLEKETFSLKEQALGKEECIKTIRQIKIKESRREQILSVTESCFYDKK
ncbi:MAG: phosphotransferase [Oscillospiraceae bacterium]|nr:phosphotransferase [Oscillospiraceae bacterium]